MVKPCPVTARKAPMSATAAYTTEFTKRVAGFVMEEKNVAFNVWRRSSSLMVSNFSMFSSSCPYARTTFWFVIISLMNAVWRPRVSDCKRNMANVFFAMKRATKMESGVTSTTTSVVQTLTESMKPMVPMIVTTPVNSCEKPIKRPSANWSTSAMMRETMSPVSCASR